MLFVFILNLEEVIIKFMMEDVSRFILNLFYNMDKGVIYHMVKLKYS